MPAVHVVLDPRDVPLQLQWDRGGVKSGLHHATLSLQGVDLNEGETQLAAYTLSKMLLDVIAAAERRRRYEEK